MVEKAGNGREPLWMVGLGQALGVVLYCGSVAWLMINGDRWMVMPKTWIGPLMVLTLLSVSVLICGLMVFYYPYHLFFEKKLKMEALRVVVWTTGWLAIVFLGLLFGGILLLS